MLLNKHFIYLGCEGVKGIIMGYLRYITFYVKTKIVADFQICISVPLKFPNREES